MMKPVVALLVIAAVTSTPTAFAFLPGRRGSPTSTPAPSRSGGSFFGGRRSGGSLFGGTPSGGSLFGGLRDTFRGSAEEEEDFDPVPPPIVETPPEITEPDFDPVPPPIVDTPPEITEPDFDPVQEGDRKASFAPNPFDPFPTSGTPPIVDTPPEITQPPETDAPPFGEANLPPALPTQTQKLFLGTGVTVDSSELEEAFTDSSRPDPVCADDQASGVVEALSQAGASVYATALDESTIASFESGIQTLLAPSDECARVASLSDCEWITRRMEGVEAANATEVNGVSEMSRRLDGAELTFTTRFWCKDQDNHGVVHVPNYA